MHPQERSCRMHRYGAELALPPDGVCTVAAAVPRLRRSSLRGPLHASPSGTVQSVSDAAADRFDRSADCQPYSVWLRAAAGLAPRQPDPWNGQDRQGLVSGRRGGRGEARNGSAVPSGCTANRVSCEGERTVERAGCRSATDSGRRPRRLQAVSERTASGLLHSPAWPSGREDRGSASEQSERCLSYTH